VSARRISGTKIRNCERQLSPVVGGSSCARFDTKALVEIQSGYFVRDVELQFFAVGFHGGILMNGRAYNMADERIAFYRRSNHAAACRSDGVGTDSSTDVSAAAGAAGGFEQQQFLCAAERNKHGECVCESFRKSAGGTAPGRYAGGAFSHSGAVGLFRTVWAEFQSAVGEPRRAVWQLTVLLSSLSPPTVLPTSCISWFHLP